MESYRYQLTKEADFKAFIGFLIDNKINFTTSHHYVPSAGDHVYHVTVTADRPEDEEIFKAVGSFLDEAVDIRKAENVDDLYENATDAYNDPYCDAGTLRTMLGVCLDHIEDLNDNHDTVYEELTQQVEDLKKEVEAEKKDKKFYQDSYYKGLNKLARVKEQIHAVATIVDALFPKD